MVRLRQGLGEFGKAGVEERDVGYVFEYEAEMGLRR